MTRSARTVVLLLLLPLAAAASLSAQSNWQGSASIGVEVHDKAGAVVAGATVAISRGAEAGGPGPTPLQTDREGRAAFSGLADGEWVLVITHPDYMAYRAYLEARTGKEAKSTFAAQVATNQSFSPMRVALYKVRGPAGVAVSAVAAAPVPEPTPAPVAAPTPPAAAPQAPATAPMAPPAPPVVPAPAPAVAPTPPPPPAETPVAPAPQPSAPPTPVAKPPAAPAPAPAAPAPSTPAPVATAPKAPAPVAPPPAAPQTPAPKVSPAAPPTPSAPPVAAPKAAPPVTPTAPPVATAVPPSAPAAAPPAAPVAPVPTVPPAPPAPVVPAPPATPPVAPTPTAPPAPSNPAVVALRSAARGTCPECKAGESALSVDGIAAAGAPGACTTALQRSAQAAMAAVAKTLAAGLQPGAPAAIDPALAGVASDGGSACRLLAVTLPSSAKFLGYRYDASDTGGSADCMQGQECPIGRASFAQHAAVERGPNGSVVWVLFENRDAQRARRAELVVYYRAAGATP